MNLHFDQMKNSGVIDLFKWLCGLWLGAMLFFTAAATPSIFSSFDKAEAGRIISVLFPGYYLANHLAFLLTTLTAIVALRLQREMKGLRPALLLLSIAWGAGPVLNQFWLAPYLRDLKTAGDLSAFGKWHGLSMILNLLSNVFVATAPWLVKPLVQPETRV